MITSLILLAIFVLILWLVFFLIGKFIDGTPLQIIGIILGIVFLARAFSVLGIHI